MRRLAIRLSDGSPLIWSSIPSGSTPCTMVQASLCAKRAFPRTRMRRYPYASTHPAGWPTIARGDWDDRHTKTPVSGLYKTAS